MKKFAVFCVLILLTAAPHASASSDAGGVSSDAGGTWSATMLFDSVIDWVSSLLKSGEAKEDSDTPEKPEVQPEANTDPCGDSTPEPNDSGCAEAFPTVVPGG